MLALILLTALAAEAGVYLAGAAWLHTTLRLPVAWIAVLAVAVALAARVAFIAATFALAGGSGCGARRGPSLSPLAGLRLFWIECAAFIALFAVLQPLEWCFKRPAHRPVTDREALPTLLLHGIYCNRAAWWRIQRLFSAWGMRNVFATVLAPPLASIDDSVALLAAQVDRACSETGTDQVILVGHSMGGLVARAYAQHADRRGRVAKIITIGSPHHGSALARCAIGRAGAQLRPGSPWLLHLNEHEQEQSPVPIVSLFSWHDNFVTPRHSALLPTATNVPLGAVGHLTMLFSRVVAARVRDEITAVSRARGTRAG